MLSRCTTPSIKISDRNIDDKDDRSEVMPANSRLGFVASPGVCGSANVNIGGSAAIASVMAPKPLSKGSGVGVAYSSSNHNDGSLHCEVHFAPHLFESCPEQQRVLREKRLAHNLCIALQTSVRLSSYPKSSIIIYITILKTSGFDFAAIVNASSLALADAKVELTGLISAYSLFIAKSDRANDKKKFRLVTENVTENLLQSGSLAEVTCCLSTVDSSVTFVRVSGSLDSNELRRHYLESAYDGCRSIHEWMVATLRHHVQSES